MATPPGPVAPGTSVTPSAKPNAGVDFFLQMLTPYFGAVFLESWLYGIYCILFCICTYVLVQRNKALHWVYLLFAICMFSLATADIGYTYYLVFARLIKGDLSFKIIYPKYVMFVTNTFLADTLLLYRCFIVWGRNKQVLAVPCVLLIGTTVVGYLFEGAVPRLFPYAGVYLATTFGLNVLLTLLTAGRIWYLKRKTRRVMGQTLMKRYSTTLTILVESGVLYSIYMVLDLAFQRDPVASTVLDAGIIQIVGIMPTLIIVQIGLGRTMQDITERTDELDRIEANKATTLSSMMFMGGNGTGSGAMMSTRGTGTSSEGALITNLSSKPSLQHHHQNSNNGDGGKYTEMLSRSLSDGGYHGRRVRGNTLVKESFGVFDGSGSEGGYHQTTSLPNAQEQWHTPGGVATVSRSHSKGGASQRSQGLSVDFSYSANPIPVSLPGRPAVASSGGGAENVGRGDWDWKGEYRGGNDARPVLIPLSASSRDSQDTPNFSAI